MRTLAMLALVGLTACSGGETTTTTTTETTTTPATTETTPATTTPATTPATTATPPAAEKVDLASMSDADRQAWLMKKGEEVYKTGGSGGIACNTCHQDSGEGVPAAFPPLKGSDFMGDCKKHAGFIVNGLSGEITVSGQKFNGQMPAQANLPDEEIAAVMTYERSSWGNNNGPCLPADVAAARSGGAAAPAGGTPAPK